MTGYARSEAEFAAADRFRRDTRPASLAPKDYSVPLHVDCSIEYELPDCAKPPQGVKIEPLLMIHPSHFRRLESLRRVPFVNNLPRSEAGIAMTAAAAAPERARARPRRCCRAAPAPPVPPPAPAQAQRQRAPQQAPAPDYRFESYAGDIGAGKLGVRPRLKPHPYRPEALDCDMARLQQVPYERFDKRALQQLPIYM
ncbi:centrosomal and chromosomal factor [Phthorimaea operculella]|nr:centrosomal and chromosomal factor [Phthorimaea operculella]